MAPDRNHVRARLAHALRRGGLLGAVILAHIAGFLLFPMLEASRRVVEMGKLNRPHDRMTIFFIQPRDSTGEAAAPIQTSKPVNKVTRRREQPKSEPPVEAVPPAEPALPAPIDWAREAEIVAGEKLLTRPEGRPLGPAGDQTSPRGLASAPRQRQFGWSQSHVQRIEPIEGGTLIWINERCAIVLSGLLMPVCKLGKIEARGDLFENMHDDSDLILTPQN